MPLKCIRFDITEEQLTIVWKLEAGLARVALAEGVMALWFTWSLTGCSWPGYVK